MGCGSSASVITASDFSPSAGKNPTAIVRRESQAQLRRLSRTSLTSGPITTSTGLPGHSRPKPPATAEEPSSENPRERKTKSHSRRSSGASQSSKRNSRTASVSSKTSAAEAVAQGPDQQAEKGEDGAGVQACVEEQHDEADGGMVSAVLHVGLSDVEDVVPTTSARSDEGTTEISDPAPVASSSTASVAQSPPGEIHTVVAVSELESIPLPTEDEGEEAQTEPATEEGASNNESAAAESVSTVEPAAGQVVMPMKEPSGEQVNEAQPAPTSALGPPVALESSQSAHQIGLQATAAQQSSQSTHAALSGSVAEKADSADPALQPEGAEQIETPLEDSKRKSSKEVNTTPDTVVMLAAPQTLDSSRSATHVGSAQSAQATRATQSSHVIVDVNSKESPAPTAVAEQPVLAESQDLDNPLANDSMLAEQKQSKVDAVLGEPEVLDASKSSACVSKALPGGSERVTASSVAVFNVSSTPPAKAQAASGEVSTRQEDDGKESTRPSAAKDEHRELGPPETLVATRSAVTVQHVSKITDKRSTTSSGGMLPAATPSPLSRAAQPQLIQSSDPLPMMGTEEAPCETSAEVATVSSHEPQSFKPNLDPPVTLLASQSMATERGAIATAIEDRSTRSTSATVSGPTAEAVKPSQPDAEPSPPSVDVASTEVQDAAASCSTEKGGPSLDPPVALLASQSAAMVNTSGLNRDDRSTHSSVAAVDITKQPDAAASPPEATDPGMSEQRDEIDVDSHPVAASAEEPLSGSAPGKLDLGPSANLLSSQSSTAVGNISLKTNKRSTQSSTAVSTSPLVGKPAVSSEQEEKPSEDCSARTGSGDTEPAGTAPAADEQADTERSPSHPSPEVAKECSKVAPKSEDAGQEKIMEKKFTPVLNPPHVLLSSASTTNVDPPDGTTATTPSLASTSSHAILASTQQQKAKPLLPMIQVQAPSVHSSRQDVRQDVPWVADETSSEGDDRAEASARDVQGDEPALDAASDVPADREEEKKTKESENEEGADKGEEHVAQTEVAGESSPAAPTETSFEDSQEAKLLASQSATHFTQARMLAHEAKNFKLKSSSASGMSGVDRTRADDTVQSNLAEKQAADTHDASPESEAVVTADTLAASPGDAGEAQPAQEPEQSAEDQATLKKQDQPSGHSDVASPPESPKLNDKAMASSSPDKQPTVDTLTAVEVQITSKSMSAMPTGVESDEEGQPKGLKTDQVVGGSTSNISKAAASSKPLRTSPRKSASKGSVRSTGSKSSIRSSSKSSLTASQYSLRSKTKLDAA